MSKYAKDNLQRLVAAAGVSIHRVAELTGLDNRTIRGILNGVKKPQARTLHRLAAGLGVSVDELFIDPALLLYRRFDSLTNPMVEEALANHGELFEGWTQADFDELQSRVGMGGPLTMEGALRSAPYEPQTRTPRKIGRALGKQPCRTLRRHSQRALREDSPAY